MTDVLIKKRNLHRETYTEAGGYEETQPQKREAWSRISLIALRRSQPENTFPLFPPPVPGTLLSSPGQVRLQEAMFLVLPLGPDLERI